jgi:hypothetical protein
MPEISKYLRLSTTHIPEPLINGPGGLDAIDGVIAYQYPEGAWLWVPDDVDEHLESSGYTPADDAKQLRETHNDEADEWPRSLEEIETLWRYARSLGCDFIRLDADEEIDPELPVYDWESAEIFKRRCIKRTGESPGEFTYAEWAIAVLGDSVEATRLAQRLLEGSASSKDTSGTGAGTFEVLDREALVAQVWLTYPEPARERLRELEGEGQFREIPAGHVDRLGARDVAARLAELYLAEADGSDNLPAAANFAV